MKKLLSITLLAIMVFSAVPVFAADTVEMKTILASVKERIGSTDEFDKFNSSTQLENGKTLYNFNWETSGDDDYKSMNVTVTASGIITQYNYNDNSYYYDYNRKPSVNKPSSEAVLATANDFIKKINPSIYKNLKPVLSNDSRSVGTNSNSFTIKRYENDIPVSGDGYLSLSEDGKKVLCFNITYDEGLSFPAPDKAISKEAAQKAYEEKVGLKLCYLTNYDGDNKTAYLAYVPVDSTLYINAITGETVKQFSRYYPYYNGKGSAEKAADGSVFTPAETGEMENIDGLMSVAQAEKSFRANSVVKLPSDYKLTNISRSKNYNDVYVYDMSFSDEQNNCASATVNAATGEIMNFYKNADFNAKKKISKNKADEIVKNALPLLSPSHFSANGTADYILDSSSEDGNYSYVRTVNGIPYNDDTVYIGVNMSDGSIYQYGLSFTDIEFPSSDKAISLKTAYEKLWNQLDYTLYYIPTSSKENATAPDSYTLVYNMSKDYIELNALTGEFKPAYNDATLPEYTDISGHYAETAINTLKNFGIGYAFPEIEPDKNISQKDFIVFIVSALINKQRISVTADYDAKYEYATAKSQRVISEDEINPDSTVTREEAAVYIVRALGYGEVADLNGIYISPFKDVKNNIGYISILSAMNVIGGDENGNFNPSGILSRGATLQILYNYLSR
ncbi:MAG: S-layer homology domain-containing protein [Bacillota bacterium]|nr:S-layer homology domain-containing protein [Bacillota bacterium]